MKLTRALWMMVFVGLGLGLGLNQAHAKTVVTFEDLKQWDTPAEGYGGINGWGQSGIVYDGNGEGQGKSMFLGAFNGELHFANGPVIVEGTFFKVYDPIPNASSIQLFYQGQRVLSILAPNTPLGLVWVETGYHGLVDTIKILGGSEGYALDNLTYSAAPVPEPESYLMFGAGLALIGALARQKRRG